MTALSTTGGPSALAINQAIPDNRFAGFTQEDLVMPQAHIVHGLPKEKEKFGKVQAGDVINTLTLEKLFSYDTDDKKVTAGDNSLVPIMAWPEWVNWPKDADRPVYRFRDRKQVPPDDLLWNDGPGGKRIPPNATQNYVFLVLFTTDPSTPLALTFKRSSAKAGQTLLTLEKMRSRSGPGLYKMTFKLESYDSGPVLVPVITPAGNPTPELRGLALEFASNFAGANITVAEESDDPLGGMEADNTGVV